MAPCIGMEKQKYRENNWVRRGICVDVIGIDTTVFVVAMTDFWLDSWFVFFPCMDCASTVKACVNLVGPKVNIVRLLTTKTMLNID